jgi:thiol-disulfide isomerase/thioredoxin
VKGLFAWLVLSCAVLTAAQPLQPVDEAGYKRLIDSHRGKIVLVNFWATWCAPCREEMPQLARIHSSLRGQGFTLLTISADEPEDEADARAFLTESKVSFPAWIKRAKDDDRFINAIDPKWSGALPALFLYDRAGKKVKSYIGEADIPQLEATIKKLLR